MEQWFLEFSPITQALIGTLFTWFLTAVGAAMVFFFKKIDRKVMDGPAWCGCWCHDRCQFLVTAGTGHRNGRVKRRNSLGSPPWSAF